MMGSRVAEAWKRRWLLPAGALVLGVAVGFVGKRAAENRGGDVGEGTEEAWHTTKSAQRAEVPVSTRRSGDTIEEIVADTSLHQDGRLALWLLDADSAQMEAMFFRLLAAEVPSRTVNLLMNHWLELDAERALAATAGTKWEHIAWRAWGRSDPERAWRAALEAGSGRAAIVLGGIGQRDPGRALRLKEKYPEAFSYQAIGSIADGLRQRDLRESIEFSRRHERGGGAELELWARRDPGAMLAWCAENEVGNRLTSEAAEALRILVREHPERVGELVDSLSTGRLRHELLRTAVQELAVVDTASARELLDRAEGRLERQELCATIGLELMGVDPAQSMALLSEAVALGSLFDGRGVVYPHGSSTHGGTRVGSLAGELAKVDPAGTLSLLWENDHGDNGLVRSVERSAISNWLQRDEVAVAEWLRGQRPSVPRDRAIEQLAGRLAQSADPDFQSAAEWLGAMQGEETRATALRQLVERWVRLDPDGAEAYVGSGAAPPEVRAAWEEQQGEARR